MSPAAPRYFSAGSSDQGFVRGNNEDRVHCDDVRGFFLVVDGMGGHEAGEHAADIAVERIRARLERQTGAAEQRIREAITLANNAIFEAAQAKPDWKGMACVLTVAMIEDSQVVIGHVGDSRLYRIKRGQIEKITHDHSPVGEREDSGEITEAEAMQHPRRNEVYRDVGTEEHTPDDEEFIEVLRIPFEPDSALLLCTDGLSDAISSKQILKIVQEHAGDRWATVRNLISAATAVGKDNVSAVLIEGAQFAASLGKRPVRQTKPRQPIVTDPQAGETTDRLVPVARPAPARGYALGAAWLVCGLIAGAALTYFAQKYLLPELTAQSPQALVVKPPDTIDGAIEKARPGDTVYVAPGTYTEAIHLKNGVDVVAQHSREAVIEGSVTADGLQRGRFEGFQVHAAGDIGIRIHDSDIEIVRNEITSARVAGVEFDGTSRGAIIASWIHDNDGAGIVITDSAAPAVENNLIISNGTKAARPGLLLRSNLKPRVIANIFLSNGAEAIWLPEADEAMIGRNYFTVSGKPDKGPRFRVIRPVTGQAEGSRERR